MVFKKIDKNLTFVEQEQKVLDLWKKRDIFKKNLIKEGKNGTYVFYDGPPTANGMPHIGHVLTRVIKDVFPRYYTMKGKKVFRKAGWDTHGLPVEIEVEKVLNLDGKEQIEEYGIESFVDMCKKNVWKYKQMWEDFSNKVGFWADMENPYITYTNDYIESVWYAIKQIYNKGLLYKGFKINHYCPRCGTSLSSHEVSQGYKLVKENTAILKFKYTEEENTYFLAWTTTPWSLPSNVALCVNPKEEYCKVKSDNGENYILAKALLDSILKNYEIIETYIGKDLEYKKYEPLFDFSKSLIKNKKAFFVTCDEYVTLVDGTGIVHIAPSFGEDDLKIGNNYNLPFIQLVNEKGNLTEPTPWNGMFVKKADPLILEYLKENNLLFAIHKMEHNYPHCWRCNTPLIYYAKESWFIKMTAVKEDLLKNNKKINWVPSFIGEGRFNDWLENVKDWNIGRNRYWGTPLNIWICECGHMHVIGSREELSKLSNNYTSDLELHRPYVDKITINCEKCGKKMHRVPEVIDCWFDSGSMPFAQYNYPFSNKEIFEKQFPADFISEALDQTRGWFYSLLAISTILFNKEPYKNVIVLGHVQDKSGQKMSKSKGNVVNPFEILEKYGADTIRWYFYTVNSPWISIKFDDKTVMECQRKFISTLYNTYVFFVLYANIDNFNPKDYSLDYSKLEVIDKWILSKLNSLIKFVNSSMAEYNIIDAVREIQIFIDNLSNWYVRRSRKRFWGKDTTQDKINAYMTLYECLVKFSKLAAPFIPFMSENIYQNLVCSIEDNCEESVHLCEYPIEDDSFIDKSLEKNMDVVLNICSLGRSCRNKSNIKIRQPLNNLYVKTDVKLSDFYKKIILEELNIKNIIFLDNISDFVTYEIKPQLKILGQKFTKSLNIIRELLKKTDANIIINQLEKNDFVVLKDENNSFSLSKEDLIIEIKNKEPFVCENDHSMAVILDTSLSEDLVNEGYVRELINKIQLMRKNANFEVTDKIEIIYYCDNVLENIFNNFSEKIKENTLAIKIVKDKPTNVIVQDWNINNNHITIGLKKV